MGTQVSPLNLEIIIWCFTPPITQAWPVGASSTEGYQVFSFNRGCATYRCNKQEYRILIAYLKLVSLKLDTRAFGLRVWMRHKHPQTTFPFQGWSILDTRQGVLWSVSFTTLPARKFDAERRIREIAYMHVRTHNLL